MSPPANRVHVVAGSKASAAAGAGRLAVSGQSARSSTRSTPNSAASPQASARTSGPDRVGAQEGETLAVLGEVGRRGSSRRGEDEARGVGRAIDAERGEDRVGLAVDELERRVAACSCRPGPALSSFALVEVGVARKLVTGTIGDVGEVERAGPASRAPRGGSGKGCRRRSRRRSRSVGASRSRPPTTGQRWRSTPRPGGRPGRRQARPRARR